MAAASPSKTKPALPNDVLSLSDEDLAGLYSFQKEIGYGNWGSIWRCQTRTYPRAGRRTLALKLVHRDRSETTAARLRSLWGEFKILRAFKSDPHVNVLQVDSFIVSPSYGLLVMSHHPSPLPVGPEANPEGSPRTRRRLRGIAAGLAFLHSSGVAHNDVKPANVVVSDAGEPVLIDFGFATAYGSDWKAKDGGHPGSAFWSNLSWGTPEYLSPERASAQWHDERLSDVWALGVTLYEVAVGRTPFEHAEGEEFLTPAALKAYHARTLGGEPLGEYALSPLLDGLVRAAIRPDPGERPASAAEVLAHPYFADKRLSSVLPHRLLSPSSSPVKSSAKRPQPSPLKVFEDPRKPATPRTVAAERRMPLADRTTNTPVKDNRKTVVPLAVPEVAKGLVPDVSRLGLSSPS